MKAKSMRNYVARNYSAPMPSQTKEHIDKKENSSVISSISERSSFQPHDDKYSYHIEEEKSYGGYATIPYIVTKHHKSNIMYFENRYEEWDAVQNVKQSLNLTWDKFYEKYQSYLTGMSPDSFEFKCQCLAIILEERKEIVALTPSPGHIVPNELISSGVTFKSWLYTAAGLIGSFFVLGGIAYVFKHLIALLWYLISWIGIILFNMVIWFFCLLFNLDGPEGMVDFENIVSPLKVWQIGGWIYGIIIVCILLWRFFTLLDKWGSKIFKT